MRIVSFLKFVAIFSFVFIVISGCGPQLEPEIKDSPSGGQNSGGAQSGPGGSGGGGGQCEGCNGEIPSSEMASSCLTEGVSHGVQYTGIGGIPVKELDPEKVKGAKLLKPLHDFSLILRGKSGAAQELWTSENVRCLK